MENYVIDRVADCWWIQPSIWFQRVSPFLTAAWADGVDLTAWPLVGVLLPLLVFLTGLGEGATH